MNERPRIRCPKCGGKTKKLIGAGAGIIFKGSGFYETDYKRKKAPPASDISAKNGAKNGEKEASAVKPETKTSGD